MKEESFTGLKKRLLREEVEDKILNLIRKTPYGLGMRLPNEQTLCSLFDVGRSTLREALKSLESRHMVLIKQGSGTYVRSLEPVDIYPLSILNVRDKLSAALDLVDLRLMVEPHIAAMAAIKADDEQKIEIRNNCELVEQHINNGEDYLKYDIAFHSAIIHAGGNSAAEQLIPMFDTAIMLFVNVTGRCLKMETVKTHRAITEAIISRDAHGAEVAMSMHLIYNREMLSEMYKENKSKPHNGNSSDDCNYNHERI